MPSKKLFLSSIIICVLLSFPIINSVWASSVMWSQTYGGEGSDHAHWLVETSDGGYAIAGYTRDLDAPEEEDFWLVKTDADGNMEWNRTYGGMESDMVRSLIVTSDGGYALAGSAWLIKTDTQGIMEWKQTYVGTDARSLVETSDGGFALAGSTWSFAVGKDDFWLVKTDRYGNLEWNRTYGGAGSDNANSLALTSDGGFALAGSTSSFTKNLLSPDFWLIKTDVNGVMEWNQTYDYNKWWEHANFVVETADGGYAIAGIAAFPPPLPVYEFWLVKTDANGNMEWSKTYGETQYEKAGSVVKTSDGGFALAGFKNSFGGWGNDFWLVKTDNYGNIEWSQTHGGSEADIARSLIETSDGGYAIAGDTSSFGAGGTDFWLVKTDEYGNIPEFPSWAILPLLFIASFAAIICKQRLLRKSANN